jgi:hypothetical protein
MEWSDVASKIRLQSRVQLLPQELIGFMFLFPGGTKVAAKGASRLVGVCGAVLIFAVSANAQVDSSARAASDLAFIPDINAARANPSSTYGVQMKRDSAAPLQYFLDKAPNDIRASTLPTTAKAVVLARVRLLGTAAGLGGGFHGGAVGTILSGSVSQPASGFSKS